MSVFSVCVPYYSSPEFPRSCVLIRNHDILPRDILLCNKTNRIHIQEGAQYDPNIENGEYRLCEPPVRRSLKKKADNYDKLYLIFRTRFLRLNGTSKYLVTGFYIVKNEFEKEDRDGPIIHAKNMRFVSISDSIDITHRMNESQAFISSFTSKNKGWKDDLTEWIQQLEGKKDQTAAYIREINRLKKRFKENEFKNKPYSECKSCKFVSIARSKCPLIWRQNTWKQMPDNKMHYMQSLDEFYEESFDEFYKQLL